MHKVAYPALLVVLTCMSLVGASLHPPQVYDSGGEKVRQVLEALRTDSQAEPPPKKTYQLSQAQINAYLLEELSHQEESFVLSFSVLLGDGNFTTMIEVDFDQLRPAEQTTPWDLLRILFKGKQTLEVEGVLNVSQGRGNYHIQQAQFSGVKLPISLVHDILMSLGQIQPALLDPTSSFPMPYGIESVVISPDQVVIET